MDCSAFYTKWLRDLAADQHEDGAVPHVIPNVLNRGGAHGWQDAATIVPWNVYRYYGDKQILERQYESMKALVDFMDDQSEESGYWMATKDRHFGDWLAFATTRSDYPGATTDKDLLATAFFYRSADLLQQSARILGKTAEAEKYAALMKKVKKAFADECLTPKGRLSSNTQTAYTVALSFGLIPESLETNAAGRLAADVNKFRHLTTGFLGTPDLLFMLAKHGYLKEAYMLLYREDYPSWLYPVTMGATTIWERWDGIKPDGSFQNPGMNSFNHYAYGAVGDFLYRKVAGIDLHPEVPGFKQFIIKPHPGDSYEPGKEMNDVKAWHNSPYGKISSEWVISNGNFELKIRIPVNTSAEVFVPSTSDALQLDGKPMQADQVDGADESYHYLKTTLGSGEYSLRTVYQP
jgi:alpha-L-rhamnosidase